MSQNKTIIQGLESAAENQQQFTENSGLYSRTKVQNVRGTIVPGMDAMQSNNLAADPTEGAAPRRIMAAPTDKPVIGFLYSISRTALGEFWPLQVGPNTIGTNEDCDIRLPEGTVSGEHAVLVVRKNKNPERVIASICDARSTNGTMLNGISLDFSAVECKNGDIITIGDNYQLYVILIDAASIGLSLSPNFVPRNLEENVMDDGTPVMPGFGGTDYNSPIPPAFGGPMGGTQNESMYQQQYNAGGTVGLDGSFNGNDRGGTVGM